MSFKFAKSLAIHLFFVFLTVSGQSTVETVITLELNKPIKREIAGGEKHSYKISLSKGQFAEIELEQKGIDLILRTFEADGKPSDWFDGQIKPSGLEKANIVAESTGIYQIDVVVKLKTAEKAKYEIKLPLIRDLTERDISYKKSNVLMKESNRLFEAGKYKDGIPFAQEALDIRDKMFHADDPEIATTKSNLANLYMSAGNFEKSEPLYLSALSIWEKAFGPSNLNVAAVISNLSNIYISRGEFAKAEASQLRVIEIREKILGKDHTLVAGAYNTLGRIYRRLEKMDKAVQMYEKALDIRERILGKDDPATATVLRNLSTLYYLNGDYAKSQVLDERVISIIEKNFGPNHESMAGALENLGLSYSKTKQFDKSEALYRRALTVYEKSFGVDSVQSVSAFLNLGVLFFDTRQYSKAEPFLIKAIQIEEPKYLDYPLEFANVLNVTGTLYGEMSDFPKSEAYLLRALEIYGKFLGTNHIESAKVYNNLARVYSLNGEISKAIAIQQIGLSINERTLSAMLQIGSERQKRDYINSVSSFWDLAISLDVAFAKENAEANENAVNAILQNKGKVLDAVTDSFESLRKNIGSNDHKLLEKLMDINNKLADSAVDSSTKVSPSDRQKRIDLLNAEKEKIEIEISRVSAGYYSPSKEISIANVRKNLPPESVLIEFTEFTPFETKLSSETQKHYAVYLIKQSGKIEVADLGEVKTIDSEIAKFRESLQNPNRSDSSQLSKGLYKKLIFPIQEFLRDSTQLLISPDGDLNLIPFEALMDESGKYLIESKSISYLSSGRDLLRIRKSKPNSNSPLIIANPNFGIAETSVHSEEQTLAKRNIKDKKRGVTVAKSLSETYFAPLSGTEQEGKSIQTLFPESVLLTGTKATKEALKSTKSPKILHIASHGFYLEDTDKTDTGNPLLRSGIALAGANLHNSNNGIVTALEASGLDLFGTKLVVLSACGTGLGEVQSGEGVFGLRRSFVLAGSESLVISLWSVSDYITRELMTNYYRNLKLGNGRSESLRKVQLEMLKNPKRKHPFYWASFIQSGNWKALDN